MLGKEFTSIRSASIAQIGSRVINVVMQLIVTMVLARLITPRRILCSRNLDGIFKLLQHSL